MVYYINENGDNVMYENITALLNDQITTSMIRFRLYSDFKIPNKTLANNPELIKNAKAAYVKCFTTILNLLIEEKEEKDKDMPYVPSVFFSDLEAFICEDKSLNI